MKKRAIAGLALASGFGIEITEADDERVTWRWSNDPAEHVSKVNSGAFRVGRTWYRLDMFERYQRYAKSMGEG